MATILVTGSEGIVGSAVVTRLAERGHRVVPVARRSSRSDVIICDLSQPDLDLAANVGARPDAVIHLAAAVPHSQWYPDTEEWAAATRRIDRAVHAAAQRWDVPVFYASTCGLYDRTDRTWKSETARLCPTTPYFRAKLDGEILMRELRRTCVMRLSSVVAPRLHRAVVLAKFVERARLSLALEIWGSGEREQDFIAASDVANFVALAIEAGAEGSFNVAAGAPITMHALASLVIEIIGSGTVSLSGRDDPQENHTARYSTMVARHSIGWRASVPLHIAIRQIADGVFVD